MRFRERPAALIAPAIIAASSSIQILVWGSTVLLWLSLIISVALIVWFGIVGVPDHWPRRSSRH